MTRRAFFATVFGVTVTARSAAASRSGAGLIVSGQLSASDTEIAEGFAALGQDIAIICRDQATYARDIQPLLGKTCELTLWEKR